VQAWNADSLVVFGGPLFNRHRVQIVNFAETQPYPAVYGLRDFVDPPANGVLSRGQNLPASFARAAAMLADIATGVSTPATMPVEDPPVIEQIANNTRALALGLTIDPAVLAACDAVI
jgi:putative ABC transport system substrate-binding protein